jgi:hypothetical protein
VPGPDRLSCTRPRRTRAHTQSRRGRADTRPAARAAATETARTVPRPPVADDSLEQRAPPLPLPGTNDPAATMLSTRVRPLASPPWCGQTRGAARGARRPTGQQRGPVRGGSGPPSSAATLRQPGTGASAKAAARCASRGVAASRCHHRRTERCLVAGTKKPDACAPGSALSRVYSGRALSRPNESMTWITLEVLCPLRRLTVP